MKRDSYFLVVLFVLSTLFFACSNGGNGAGSAADTTTVKSELSVDKQSGAQGDSTKVSEQQEDLGIEYTSKFICPNHCKGSGSDKEGECSNPECGMELMENPNYKEK